MLDAETNARIDSAREHPNDSGASGPQNISTTMVYTHVLDKGGHGVRSPTDTLASGCTACMNLKERLYKRLQVFEMIGIRRMNKKIQQLLMDKRLTCGCRIIQAV